MRYIDLMEKVLSAYSAEHIDRYYNDVKTGGLKEHGFPRLTADIGILISYGRRTDLLPRFIKLMDLCCEEIPKRKYAGNEFSVKEIIFALQELEKHRTLPQNQIDQWKAALKKIKLETAYNVYAEKPDSVVYNWAAFTMVSEWMRYKIGAAPLDMEFIDNQAASQWQWVDENGMYKDPNEPIVYELVTRGLFALINHLGYRGKYFERWDDALKRAGLHTLKMLSVTGEMPYGGRSNQFIHNEAHLALVMEYEARRYAKLGDMEMAGKFKAGVLRVLENVEFWLNKEKISHVKNSFPIATQYGCEHYAYFDKYMITAASFLYVAYLMSDESIPAGKLDDLKGESWQTSEAFHKVFLRGGEYFAEYDYRADYHYDASGLGRLHRKGAPGPIGLSTPGADKPTYKINADDAVNFAIVPEVLKDGKWLSGAEKDVVHRVKSHSASGESASAQVDCIWPDQTTVQASYRVDKNGLTVMVNGGDTVGLMLPVFRFDGADKTVVVHNDKLVTVSYKNWICRFQAINGVIKDTGKKGYNRNGHYDLFRAEGGRNLEVKITIEPAG